MGLSFLEREKRRQWALNNPDKVRFANQRWRAHNLAKHRRQTAERMRRLRARRKINVTPVP